MTTAEQISGTEANDHRSIVAGPIKGRQVKDVITKYFYRGNSLCFQIVLEKVDGKALLFLDCTDYSEYQKALTYLHTSRDNDAMIEIPKKSLEQGVVLSKVA